MDRRASYQDESKKNTSSTLRSLRKILTPGKINKLKKLGKWRKQLLKRKKRSTDGTKNGDDSANFDNVVKIKGVTEEADITVDESSPSVEQADPVSRHEECAPLSGKHSPDETNTIKSQNSFEGGASALGISSTKKSSSKHMETIKASITSGSNERDGIEERDAPKDAGAAQSDIISEGKNLAVDDPRRTSEEGRFDLPPDSSGERPNTDDVNEMPDTQPILNGGKKDGAACDGDEVKSGSSVRSLVQFPTSTLERGRGKIDPGDDGSIEWDEISGPQRTSNDDKNDGLAGNVGAMKSESSMGSSVRVSDLLHDKNNNNTELDDDEGSLGSIGIDEVFSHPNGLSESKLSVTNLCNESDVLSRRLAHSNISSYFADESLYNLLVWQEKMTEWLSSFYRTDPRWQIMRFFGDVAREGATNLSRTESEEEMLRFTSPILKMFARSSVFTVWRPTSLDAIRKMMLREGTGKGLDIKGKSAKKGKLSGYVPFLQIHDNNHKKKVGTLHYDGRIRIFYKTKSEREKVVELLEPLSKQMMRQVNTAKLVLSKDPIDVSNNVWEAAAENMFWEMKDPSVTRLDLYAPQCYGIEVPERLFWEGYVVRQDCSREPGSEYETGRPSEPAFQDMNFATVRKGPQPDKPRAVIWQYDDTESPMRPTTLLMAYEERGRVLPVVSDFDAFLVGTRGVRYHDPLPPEQIEIVHWCITQVETILDKKEKKSWTSQWLRVMKENAQKGARHNVPSLGYGDPKTYAIFDHAKRRLEETNGAVRHAAECFNYGFPQEIDNEFLVISDTLPGNVPWKYVSVSELQDLLCEKIKEGFTFPLHPKWILCDPGWKRVYDQLVASTNENTQASLNCWFPPESGLRKRIETIHSKHPFGFTSDRLGSHSIQISEMVMVEHQLNRYLALMRAKRKLRNIMFWIKFCRQSQRHLRAREEVAKNQGGNSRNILVVEDDDDNDKSTDETENAEY